MLTGKELVFGLHIPKCAGTTLMHTARATLRQKEIYQSTSILQNYQNERPEFLYILNYSELRFVFGHDVHEEMLRVLHRPVFLFTGLREPLQRLKSEINYNLSLVAKQGLPKFDIDAFLLEKKSPQCRRIVKSFPTLAGAGKLFERALRVLDHFHLIYNSDDFGNTTSEVYRRLDLTFDGKKHNVGSYREDEIDIGKADIEDDIKLYDIVRSRFGVVNSKPNALDEFIEKPADMKKLRTYLANCCYWEYKNWGLLPTIKKRKQEMVDSLVEELRYYNWKENN